MRLRLRRARLIRFQKGWAQIQRLPLKLEIIFFQISFFYNLQYYFHCPIKLSIPLNLFIVFNSHLLYSIIFIAKNFAFNQPIYSLLIYLFK